jgi:Icc-related predicted phosphoesterase
MKALVISDTHGLHKAWEKIFPIPDVDMIIHGGDLTNVGSTYDFEKFLDWFDGLNIEHKVMIAGNHDLGLDSDNYQRMQILEDINRCDIHYLQDSGVEIEGIKFWGSPVTPPFMNWAFMRTPEKIQPHWEAIPDDTDVLITHGPPHGVLDYVDYRDQGSVGCPHLMDRVHQIKPKYHIFGHIHDMYGIREVEGVTHINAAILDGRYHPVRAGHIIEL